MVNKSKVKSATSPATSWWNERNKILASLRRVKPAKVKHRAKKAKAKKPVKTRKVMKMKKAVKARKTIKKSKKPR